MKKSFAEQRTALINEVIDLKHKSSFEMLTVRNLKFVSTTGQAGMILNEDEINNILNGLDQKKLPQLTTYFNCFMTQVYLILFSINIKFLQII